MGHLSPMSRKREEFQHCSCNVDLGCGGYCEECQLDMQTLEKCQCEKAAVYELLRTGLVGGRTQVFTRYHEKNITCIRFHVYGEKGKLTKGIIGYDANGLYLYCSGDVMRCGKDSMAVNKKPFEQKRIVKISRDVLRGKNWFVQVDIELPDDLYDTFSKMPPLFVVQEIPDCAILVEMKVYKEKTGRTTVKGTKKLLGVMKTKKILFYTPVLEWYLQHDLRFTAVHQLIEYKLGMPFLWFPEAVANARREADKDLLKKQLDDVAKQKGNSFYGKMIEDKGCHKRTRVTREERVVGKTLRSPFFDSLEEVGGAYEINEFKRTVVIKRPYQCGNVVYKLAKLRMLEFYYDFLDKYFSIQDFELYHMDTDLFYLAISGDSLDDVVRPEMRQAYEADKKNWLATGKFSERTRSLFKPQFVGTRGMWLTATSYLVQNEINENKYSCKGISKKHNDLHFQRYKDALDVFLKTRRDSELEEKDIEKVNNVVLRVYDQGVLTYEQNKLGLSAYYDKRYSWLMAFIQGRWIFKLSIIDVFIPTERL